jgi:hypothetical protein
MFNFQLRSITGASLHTRTSLVELIITSNERLYQTECVDRLPPTTFPNLTKLLVSFVLQHILRDSEIWGF